MSDQVRLRRAYDPAEDGDGYRVLVDRLWPRGIKRDALQIDEWTRDVAPSADLRKWYGHQVDRWDEFRRRYRDELSTGSAASALDSLVEHARQGPLTLVFGARDVEHSQAEVLRELIEQRLHSTAAGDD